MASGTGRLAVTQPLMQVKDHATSLFQVALDQDLGLMHSSSGLGLERNHLILGKEASLTLRTSRLRNYSIWYPKLHHAGSTTGADDWFRNKSDLPVGLRDHHDPLFDTDKLT
jgi:hypothetical protein